MTGTEIKNLIHSAGLKCWQVAELWGLNDGNFSRRLRKPFNDDEVARIRSIIEQLQKNTSCKMSAVPRFRTIRETAKLSGITEYSVRRLCKTGKFTGYVKVGNRTLIDYECFLDFLG